LKILHIIFASIFLTACSGRQGSKQFAPATARPDTVLKHDTVYINNHNDWQEGFGLTHDTEVDSIWFKPVKFYIDNPNCSPIAIDFYQGQFRPTDNHTTAALLKLVTTDDNNLRPFYRWCLQKTIQIQDGALGEYTAFPARQYAEKFPKEFFEYMDSDSSLDRFNAWVESIGYSGFYDNEDYNNAASIRQGMASTMKQHCKGCKTAMLQRIDTLAKNCFP
jgi:hypothetical protein